MPRWQLALFAVSDANVRRQREPLAKKTGDVIIIDIDLLIALDVRGIGCCCFYCRALDKIRMIMVQFGLLMTSSHFEFDVRLILDGFICPTVASGGEDKVGKGGGTTKRRHDSRFGSCFAVLRTGDRSPLLI